MASALTPLLLLIAVWILAASVLPGEAYGDPKPIDWNIYDKRMDMEKELRSLIQDSKYFQLSQCYNEGTADTSHDRGVMYKATIDVVDIKFPGPIPDEERLRVMLIYGEHGRELISAESGMSLLRRIRGLEKFAEEKKPTDYALMDMVEKAGFRPVGTDDELVKMLQHVIITVLPLENPNGRDIVEERDQCQRINGRGVDLNRNYAVDWGIREPDYEPTEEYGGVEPFSEPETRCTLSLAKNRRPHVYVNVHSGMHSLMMPWDHKPYMVKGHERDMKLLSELNEKYCKGICKYGPGAKTVGYRAHGTMGDYIVETFDPIFYTTFEVYGWTDAPYEECYQMFNPQTEVEKNSIAESYSEAVLYVMHQVLFSPEYSFASRIKVKGDDLRQKEPSTGAGPRDHESLQSTIKHDLAIIRSSENSMLGLMAIVIVMTVAIVFVVRQSLSPSKKAKSLLGVLK